MRPEGRERNTGEAVVKLIRSGIYRQESDGQKSPGKEGITDDIG